MNNQIILVSVLTAIFAVIYYLAKSRIVRRKARLVTQRCIPKSTQHNKRLVIDVNVNTLLSRR